MTNTEGFQPITDIKKPAEQELQQQLASQNKELVTVKAQLAYMATQLTTVSVQMSQLARTTTLLEHMADTSSRANPLTHATTLMEQMVIDSNDIQSIESRSVT
jgi:septal ring factor EnvC (AmiA/AmiB activator)